MADHEGDHEAGEAGFVTETIRLFQVTLGLEPWTLIRLKPASDGSGEPALHLETGGGAEEDPLAMVMLMVTEVAPENSLVAQMLRELAESGHHDADTLAAVAAQFNPDWPDWVLRRS
jgi:hypothetical protein